MSQQLIQEAYTLIELQNTAISVLKEHVRVLKERISDDEEIIDLLKKNLAMEMQLRETERKLALTSFISLN